MYLRKYPGINFLGNYSVKHCKITMCSDPQEADVTHSDIAVGISGEGLASIVTFLLRFLKCLCAGIFKDYQ